MRKVLISGTARDFRKINVSGNECILFYIQTLYNSEKKIVVKVMSIGLLVR